jgi:hypothetical protein
MVSPRGLQRALVYDWRGVGVRSRLRDLRSVQTGVYVRVDCSYGAGGVVWGLCNGCDDECRVLLYTLGCVSGCHVLLYASS